MAFMIQVAKGISSDFLSTEDASTVFKGVGLLPERIQRSNLALNVTAYCACRENVRIGLACRMLTSLALVLTKPTAMIIMRVETNDNTNQTATKAPSTIVDLYGSCETKAKSKWSESAETTCPGR